jgi:hypothetical protein
MPIHEYVVPRSNPIHAIACSNDNSNNNYNNNNYNYYNNDDEATQGTKVMQ